MKPEKICSICGKTKLVSEFHKNRNRPDGYRCACKVCRKLESRQQQQNQNKRRKTRRATDQEYRAKENQRTRKYNQDAAARERFNIAALSDRYVVRAFIRNTNLKPDDVKAFPELIELQRAFMIVNRYLKRNGKKH